MAKLWQFRDKPGTILDAFNEQGEHLGTIMVVELPPILRDDNLINKMQPRSVPIVVLKQALPIPHHSRRLPRGHVGFWTGCTVKAPE